MNLYRSKLRQLSIILNTFGINLRSIFFLKNIFKYCFHFFSFLSKNGRINNIYPFLEFNTIFKEHENQFFHADLLISKKVFNNNPKNHLDIGSRIDGLVGQLSIFRKVDALNLQKINIFPHKNINLIQKDILQIKNNEFKKYQSISSVGVLGHIGLGRYGDKIDPAGHLKAINIICNYLIKKKGIIYLMVPVGKESVHFNSHRVFDTKKLIKIFHQNKCILKEFHLINDEGKLKLNFNKEKTRKVGFCGGIFIFEKK